MGWMRGLDRSWKEDGGRYSISDTYHRLGAPVFVEADVRIRLFGVDRHGNPIVAYFRGNDTENLCNGENEEKGKH